MSTNKYLKWLADNTPSRYWNDSADVQDIKNAMENGATGVTTNPVLAIATLKGSAAFWKERLEPSIATLSGNEKAEALNRSVAVTAAKLVAPLYKAGTAKGYCCAQLNPLFATDADTMLAAAERYHTWAENLVIKIPATAVGLKVYEECAARGYNVAATVSFTVPQVLAFGAAFQRGAERARANGVTPGLGIAVLMEGRLDDYLRDVARDTGAACLESDIRQSGVACIKRAYRIFRERGYECKIMPAGCRGPYHISEIAGADMVMSIGPKIAEALLDAPMEERINRPVDPEVIARLQTMPEFVKAYEPDGLAPDEFISYGVVNRTLTQFCECGWKAMVDLGI